MDVQAMTKTVGAERATRRELLDNDQVRVIESVYPRESGVPIHAHPFPHLVYGIEGGTMEVTSEDGVATVIEVRAGETMWRAPQTHSTCNIGPTPVRIVEVEIKHAGAEGHRARAPLAVTPPELAWKPDPLDPARTAALLMGDPTKAGPYTMRSRVGAGYSVPLHWHPGEDENLTVLTGSLHWSIDPEGSGGPEYVLPAGGFVFFPAGTPHRLWTTEETVVQMSGVGPRVYVYAEGLRDSRARHL